MDIAHAADRARVRELAELFRRNFCWAVRSDEAVEAALGHPANVVLEWRERGRLMGAAVMRRNTVLMLCVDERARRQGIGSALLARCEALLREQGYAEVSVGAGDDYLLPGVPSIGPCAPTSSEPQGAAADEPLAGQGEEAHAPSDSESQGSAQDEPHVKQDREARAPTGSESQGAAADEPLAGQGEEAHAPTGSESQVAAQDEPHAGQDREAHAPTSSESQVAAQDELHAKQDEESHALTGSEPQVAADAARSSSCGAATGTPGASASASTCAPNLAGSPARMARRWMARQIRMKRRLAWNCVGPRRATVQQRWSARVRRMLRLSAITSRHSCMCRVRGGRCWAVEAARVVGVLIAGCGEAVAGVGGIACVAVVPERRGRGIARALVCAATGALRRAGMARGFIGYTYSGLEQLYGAAGYRISMRYFMARKPL